MDKDSLSTEVINDEDETSENYLSEKTTRDNFSLDKVKFYFDIQLLNFLDWCNWRV